MVLVQIKILKAKEHIMGAADLKLLTACHSYGSVGGGWMVEEEQEKEH